MLKHHSNKLIYLLEFVSSVIFFLQSNLPFLPNIWQDQIQMFFKAFGLIQLTDKAAALLSWLEGRVSDPKVAGSLPV